MLMNTAEWLEEGLVARRQELEKKVSIAFFEWLGSQFTEYNSTLADQFYPFFWVWYVKRN